MKCVLYIHGKGGNAAESGFYIPLFSDCFVSGLDYKTFTPWETGKEIRTAVAELKEKYDGVMIVANSIGAFFCMNAKLNGLVEKAYFISPVVDMEALILGMMYQSNVTEDQLKEKGEIGELSWEYLCYVREHPLDWRVPTHIIYGENDVLTPYETVKAFAAAHNAELSVMNGGEHWFHTKEQMDFIRKCIMKNNIAYCGLDCEKCDAYIATQNDDDALREKVAKLWSELNGVEITPQMINCDGCREDGRKTPFCESLCQIRQCGLEKKYKTCGDCAQLESCDKVGMIIKNKADALNNLKK